MTNLRPPDGRVFVEIEKKHNNQCDAKIVSVGNNVDFEDGQKICIVGKLEKVEVQGIEIYSVHERDIVFIYE